MYFSIELWDLLFFQHQFSPEQCAEVRWRRGAFFAYAFVIFAVGIPLWWATTTPHRARLPRFDVDIEQVRRPQALSRKNVS